MKQPTPEILTYPNPVYIISDYGTIYSGKFEDLLAHLRKLDIVLSDKGYMKENSWFR